MSSSPVVGARVPGPPPPPDRIRDRLRRRVMAVGAQPGLRHWLAARGSVLLVAYAGLYLAGGAVIGWKTAYDVMIGIVSPGDVPGHVPVAALAWLLSIAGWLAAPAVCGAVAGVVIGVAIGNRRRRPISEVLTKHEPAR